MPKPGFSILVCPDAALIKEELQKRTAAWASAKQIIFWGDEEPQDTFWESLQQIGLFAEKRIIIVRQAQLWPASTWKTLSQALSRPADHIWLFLCLEVKMEKGAFQIPAYIKNALCFKYAEKEGWIWRNEGLANKIEPFVSAHATQAGLKFTPPLLARFCASVAPDAHSILNELQKLQLLAEDGLVTEEILPESSYSLENDAFGLLQKMWAGDISGFWKEIGKDTEGSLLFFVIALLSRDFRLLWQIRAGENPRLHPAQAQTKKKLATKLGFEGIAKGFAALADAEWQVKSGQLAPAQVLETLAMYIGSLASPPARSV